MARPNKGKDKAKDPRYQQVGIYLPQDSHHKAKMIAAYKNENLRDMLGLICEEYIDREYGKVLEAQTLQYNKEQQRQYIEDIVNQD